MKRITFAVVLLAFMAAPLAAQRYSPKEGEKHPALVLPEIMTGEPLSLSNFAGTKVLLIHFASW